MSKKPPQWYIRRRRYPEKSFVSLWLCRRDGPAEACLMWGEMIPAAADEIVAALGLPVEQDNSPYATEPLEPPGCAPVAKQKELFA